MVDKATAQLGGEGRGTSPQREHTHEKHTREFTGTQNDPTHRSSKQREPQSHKGTRAENTHDRGRRGINNTTPDPAPVNTPKGGKPNPWRSPHTTRGNRTTEERERGEKHRGEGKAITTTIAANILSTWDCCMYI